MFENYGAAGVTLSWRKPGSATKQVVPADVLFRDARGVLDITTDRDLFIPVSGPATRRTPPGWATSRRRRPGPGRQLPRLPGHQHVLDRIPSFVDGNFLHNAAAAGRGDRDPARPDLPAHVSLDLEFVLAIIGTLGRQRCGPRARTSLRIEVDGDAGVRRDVLERAAASRRATRGAGVTLRSGTDLGFGAGQDALYDLTGAGPCASIAAHGQHGRRSASTPTAPTTRAAATSPGPSTTCGSWSPTRAATADRVLATDFNDGLPASITGPGQLVPVQGFGPTLTRLDTGVVSSGMWVDAATGFTSSDAGHGDPRPEAELRGPLARPAVLRPAGRRGRGQCQLHHHQRRRPPPDDRRRRRSSRPITRRWTPTTTASRTTILGTGT